MKKLSQNQRRRLQELTERNETINKIVIERIDDTKQALPLNLILEVRFNEMMKKAINLEGEIAHLKGNDTNYARKQIEVKSRRLDSIKSQLKEMTNIGDMLREYDELGRNFEIVPK